VAMGWAGRAIELARRLDDQETLSHALTNIGSARLQGGDPAGRFDLEEAFQVAVDAGLDDHAARAIGNLATISAEIRDDRHARADLDRALAFVQARELTGWVQHVLGHRARVRLDHGDWAGAEQDARAALAEPVKGGARVVDALVPLGLLQARRGDPDAAATLQEATERAFATGELQWTAPVAAAGPSMPGCTGTTAGPPRRSPASSSWPCRPRTVGSPGSWPSGCGWPARRFGHRR
jgi:hypothetical protein